MPKSWISISPDRGWTMTCRIWLAALLLQVLLTGLTASRLPADESATAATAATPAPQWFKGNLHTHSLWSDGNDFPEMIADWYQRQGYNFLALSDHNLLSEGDKWIDEAKAAKRGAIGGFDRYLKRFGTAWVETRERDGKREIRLKPLNEFRPLFDKAGSFLMLQCEEITDGFGNQPIHINASNIRDAIKPQGGKSVQETIKNNLVAVQQQSQRVGQPILAHLNHPNFGYGVTAEDLAAVIEEQFFEIYNGHPGVNHLGDDKHVGMERLWDIANTLRIGEMKSPPLYGMGTDDSHNYFGERGASPGRGWVMVRSRFLTPTHLIAAMNAGDFYASSGVELKDVRFDAAAKTLQVEVQAEPEASYTIEFVGTRQGYDRQTKPVVDDKGQPIVATRTYSADVGRVFAKTTGTKASYQLQGDELYVRAVITSSKAPRNPAFENQLQQAWTQPVGWQKWIAPPQSE